MHTVLITYVTLLGIAIYLVMVDGPNHRTLFDKWHISEHRICSRYLDRIKNANYFRYSFLTAITATTATFIIQFLFGLYSNCPGMNCNQNIATSVIIFLLVLFVSFKIQNCWMVRVLCGGKECCDIPVIQ